MSRNLIATWFPDANRLEMFCRYPAPGWHVWGNQVDSTRALEAPETFDPTAIPGQTRLRRSRMTATQLEIPTAVHADPQPWAVDDRDRILAAWIADDVTHGHVSPNCVRALLTSDAGHLTVNARRLAASYTSPLLVRVGEVRSDDKAGRNVGAVIGLYAFKGDA